MGAGARGSGLVPGPAGPRQQHYQERERAGQHQQRQVPGSQARSAVQGGGHHGQSWTHLQAGCS